MASHRFRGGIVLLLAFAIALFALASHAVLAAESSSLNADVTFTTDYVTRGVSQTMSRPALQASAGVMHESGWSVWLWGSNVDYVADGDPDDGAWLEVDVVLEYERALTERIGAAVGFSQYLNPGVNPGLEYDYAEWTGRLLLDDRHRLSVAWSDNIFGSGAPALYLAAATGFELPAGLWLELEVGCFDLDRAEAWGDAYNHASATLSGSVNALTWEFAWHAASSHARNAFYESVVEPRAVLSVTYTLW